MNPGERLRLRLEMSLRARSRRLCLQWRYDFAERFSTRVRATKPVSLHVGLAAAVAADRCCSRLLWSRRREGAGDQASPPPTPAKWEIIEQSYGPDS